MSKTRYWQHNETGRLLKVDVKMAPSHWVEITREQYEKSTMSNAELLLNVAKEISNVQQGKYAKP